MTDLVPKPVRINPNQCYITEFGMHTRHIDLDVMMGYVTHFHLGKKTANEVFLIIDEKTAKLVVKEGDIFLGQDINMIGWKEFWYKQAFKKAIPSLQEIMAEIKGWGMAIEFKAYEEVFEFLAWNGEYE